MTDEGAHVTLRPVADGDEEFLREVFASSRAEELAALGWTDEQQAGFVDFQFRAQTSDYLRRFPGSEHSVVLVDGKPAGRMWVASQEGELRLLDLTMAPGSRGQGVGTLLLRRLQERAVREDVPLRHTVLVGNDAALRLYRRLGFVTVGTTGMHVLMEWRRDLTPAG